MCNRLNSHYFGTFLCSVSEMQSIKFAFLIYATHDVFRMQQRRVSYIIKTRPLLSSLSKGRFITHLLHYGIFLEWMKGQFACHKIDWPVSLEERISRHRLMADSFQFTWLFQRLISINWNWQPYPFWSKSKIFCITWSKIILLACNFF